METVDEKINEIQRTVGAIDPKTLQEVLQNVKEHDFWAIAHDVAKQFGTLFVTEHKDPEHHGMTSCYRLRLWREEPTVGIQSGHPDRYWQREKFVCQYYMPISEKEEQIESQNSHETLTASYLGKAELLMETNSPKGFQAHKVKIYKIGVSSLNAARQQRIR